MDLLAAAAFQWTLVLVLALVFLPSAWSKLRAPDEVLGVVENYRLVPAPLVAPVARALPVLEIGAGLGLLLPPTRGPGGLLAAGLFLVFALAMAINLGRGRTEIDCGCFLGRHKDRISWALVGRNLVLAAGGLLVALAPAAAVPGALDLATTLLATASLLALYAAYSRLSGLAPLRRQPRGS